MSFSNDKIGLNERISTEVRVYITEYFLLGATADFADDTSLLDAGILDSTGATELVSFLEAQYEIPIADDELVPENLDSIDKITAFVRRKLNVSGAPQGTAASQSHRL